MVQKGPKEAPKMVPNGPQWSKGPKWSPMVKNILKPFSETETLQKLAKVSRPRPKLKLILEEFIEKDTKVDISATF